VAQAEKRNQVLAHRGLISLRLQAVFTVMPDTVVPLWRGASASRHCQAWWRALKPRHNY